MKANGISLYRIARPVVAFALLACGLNFLLNEFVTPAANWQAEYIKYVEVQKKKEWGAFKENQIWYKSQNAIYNFKLFAPAENRLKGVTISYLDARFNLLSRIDAREALWKGDRWELRDVLRTTFAGKDFPVIERLPTLDVDIAERPEDFQIVQKSADQMGFRELRNYIRKLRQEGYDATRYETDLHGKIAFVFVSLILALIGVAFPMRSERSGGIAQGIGIGVIIGFSYWIVFAFTLSLGRSGTLPARCRCLGHQCHPGCGSRGHVPAGQYIGPEALQRGYRGQGTGFREEKKGPGDFPDPFFLSVFPCTLDPVP